MTYRYKKTGFVSALALGVAMMGLAGVASASSIHVLTSDGRVLLTETATGNTSLVNTIAPPEDDVFNVNHSPNSLGFFEGTFYATTFRSDGDDETIYRFDKDTSPGDFVFGTTDTGTGAAFAAGDANADGFSVVDNTGDLAVFDGSGSDIDDFTTSPSIFGDIAFDTFNPGVTFASYSVAPNSGGDHRLERYVNGILDEGKPFDRYVGLGFDERGQLFGVLGGGGIFALDFGAGTSNARGTISADVLDGAVVTDAASVTPVPLPAAGWLMLVGFGGLAALRRRKRTA